MDILLLNGIPGVGKSRMALDWAEARGGVVIEGDRLRCNIRDPALRRDDHFQEALVLELAIGMARQYGVLGRAMVIEYVWRLPAWSTLKATLDPLGRVRAVVLSCDPEINAQRDADRESKKVMGAMVDRLRQLFASQTWPDWVHDLDTSADRPPQSLARIEALFADP